MTNPRPIFSKQKFLLLLLLFALLLPSCKKSGDSSGNGGGGNNTVSSESSESVKSNANTGSNSGGGKVFNNADELKEYLDKQPANGPDKPVNVTVNVSASTLPKIAEAIDSAGKYVNLSISGGGLTTIPRGAFNGCKTMLTGLTLPNSVTKIDYWAFMNCTSLKSITIPNSVTSIGANAFNNCTALTSIAVPKSVTEIGENAFSKCTNLTSVKFENTYSRNLVSADFDKAYWNGGRQTGTYTRPSVKSTTWTNTSPPSFPSGLVRTWKRVNKEDTLAVEKDRFKFKKNKQTVTWILSSVSGEWYTVVIENNLSFNNTINMKTVSGSLEISGDSNYMNDLNGKWEKQ